MSRVRRRWIVYDYDPDVREQILGEEGPNYLRDDDVRHLICESCRGETECGLMIGDNRNVSWVFLACQRWFTRPTKQWSRPACEDCLSIRADKLERGYRAGMDL